jgi:TolA-binding protein
MKQLLVITACMALFVGCNFNESKEARIQKLETQIEQTTNKLQELENRIQTLDSDGNRQSSELENSQVH